MEGLGDTDVRTGTTGPTSSSPDLSTETPVGGRSDVWFLLKCDCRRHVPAGVRARPHSVKGLRGRTQNGKSASADVCRAAAGARLLVYPTPWVYVKHNPWGWGVGVVGRTSVDTRSVSGRTRVCGQ